MAGLGAAAAWNGLPTRGEQPRHGQAAAGRNVNERLQVAVIGCGQRGQALLDIIARGAIPGAMAICACDAWAPHRARAAARYGVRACADWREAVAREDIDAVMIATPDHCHAEAAVAALDAGKHVYCESPMTRTADEARALHAAWRRSSRPVQIGVTELSQPGWRKACDIVQRGDLGPVAWCQAAANVEAAPARGSAPRWQRWLAWGNGPALRCQFRQMAGFLSVLPSADPVRVSAAGGCAADGPGDAPDQMMTTVAYECGTTVTLTSGIERPQEACAILRGDRRALFVCGQDAILLPRGAPLPKAVPPAETHTEEEALKAHVRDWSDAIASGRPCRCSPEIALHAQRIIGAALEAWRCARSVEFRQVLHT